MQRASGEPPRDDGGYQYYYGGAEHEHNGWEQPVYTQPPVLQLHQPVYSQHHANLDGAVDSSRWTAMYGSGSYHYDMGSSSSASEDTAGVRAPLHNALRNGAAGATVGDMLEYVPPLQQSPPAGQPRALYDEVSSVLSRRERTNASGRPCACFFSVY